MCGWKKVPEVPGQHEEHWEELLHGDCELGWENENLERMNS